MLPEQVSSHDGKEMEVLGWFHQGPSVEQNLGEAVSVPGDRGIPDLRFSVSAFPFHRGRRPRCGVRGRRPHRPGHSRPPTAAPETPGGRGASEPSPVTPAETRGGTGVMAGIWGSSQTRVWVGVPAWLLGEGVEASRGWKLSHRSSGRPRRVQRYLQRA